MYTYLCLSIYLSIYLFIYLSIYLNIYGHGREEIERGVQVRMKYEVRNMECGQERSKCCDMFFLYRELLRSFLAEIAPIFYPKFCSDLFRHGPDSHLPFYHLLRSQPQKFRHRDQSISPEMLRSSLAFHHLLRSPRQNFQHGLRSKCSFLN